MEEEEEDVENEEEEVVEDVEENDIDFEVMEILEQAEAQKYIQIEEQSQEVSNTESDHANTVNLNNSSTANPVSSANGSEQKVSKQNSCKRNSFSCLKQTIYDLPRATK